MAKLQKVRQLAWEMCDGGVKVLLTQFLMKNPITVSIFVDERVLMVVQSVTEKELEFYVVIYYFLEEYKYCVLYIITSHEW